MVRILLFPFFVYFLLNGHTLDADRNEPTVVISRALGMLQDCLWQEADRISDWMIETMQEIVNKLTRQNVRLFLLCPMSTLTTGNTTDCDLNRRQVAAGRPELAVTSGSVEEPQPRA